MMNKHTLSPSPQTFFHKKKKPEDFLMENTPTVYPQKESEDFLMENTQTFFHKKGRGKQKIPPSGSLVPVVQKKRSKQGSDKIRQNWTGFLLGRVVTYWLGGTNRPKIIHMS
jgi:hypothetical protein